MAKKSAKKPPGFDEFDKVFRGLMQVPKSELSQQLETRVKRKRRKNK